MEDDTSVRVAVRVRPLVGSERVMQCRECVRCVGQSVVLGNKRTFSFDSVHSSSSEQTQIYEQTVQPLLHSFMKGYNATIIAYGQTGSGKTFTMGTDSSCTASLPEEIGVVPRFIANMFQQIDTESGIEYNLRCSFMEIHNEDLNDLLDSSRKSKAITIREATNGDIVPFGVTEKHVKSASELLTCLEEGSVYRSTGSTLMNAQSSRSHAIFTIYLNQRRTVCREQPLNNDDDSTASKSCDVNDEIRDEDNEVNSEFLTSKFHFVDLAGSERLKKTGAVGARRKEGININQGLLALGNCISALGDPARKGSHVPFRDSKITRLLQDSLGGNSKTLMIACLSPADVHFEETLNSLRYAARARNIKNSPIVNRDPNSAKLEMYRQRIKQLESALIKMGGDTATLCLDDNQIPLSNGLDDERQNIEVCDLRDENANLDREIVRLQSLLQENRLRLGECEDERRFAVEARDSTQLKLNSLIDKLETKDIALTSSLLKECDMDERIDIVKEQLVTIEKLKHTVEKKDTEIKHLRKRQRRGWSSDDDFSVGDVTVRQPQPSLHNNTNTNDVLQHESQQSMQIDDDFEPEIQQDDESCDESELEEEASELESLKKKKDREFRRVNSRHTRAIRRIDHDIDNKTAMIERLQNSSQYSHTLRERYQLKMNEMKQRVKTTQQERDQVLSQISSSRQETEEATAKFNAKILSLQTQLAEYRLKFKENEQLLRTRPRHDNTIRTLRDDIERYKKQRVALTRQMREASDKHRDWVNEQNRQIKRLQKESRIDQIAMVTMKHKLQRQDVVMKLKTEKNTVLQRELHQAKQRMTNAGKKRVPHGENAVKRIKQCVKREIEKACEVGELIEQEHRLLQQQKELKHSIDECRTALKSFDSQEGEPDENEINALDDRYQTMQEQLEYVNSELGDIEPSLRQLGARHSYRNGRSRKRVQSSLTPQALTRLGISGIDTARNTLLVTLNLAISLRSQKSSMKRRIEELEAEVNNLQTEAESGESRLEVVQRNSDRRLITVESEHERNIRSLMDQSLPHLNAIDVGENNNCPQRIRDEISQIKRERRELMSPLPPTPQRNNAPSRLRGRVLTMETKLSHTPEPTQTPTSVTSVLTDTVVTKPMKSEKSNQLIPSTPSSVFTNTTRRGLTELSSSAQSSVSKRTRSQRKAEVAAASATRIDRDEDLGENRATDHCTLSVTSRRDVLSRLTDKSLFTGTSRFTKRKNDADDPAATTTNDIENDENIGPDYKSVCRENKSPMISQNIELMQDEELPHDNVSTKVTNKVSPANEKVNTEARPDAVQAWTAFHEIFARPHKDQQ